MTVYTYPQPNMSGGVDTLLVSTQASLNAFVPLTLLFVFCIVLIGGAMSQKRRTGTADIPMWSTLAGISTLLIALPMSLIEGLIRLDWLIIVVVLTISSGIWLFLDRNRNEI